MCKTAISKRAAGKVNVYKIYLDKLYSFKRTVSSVFTLIYNNVVITIITIIIIIIVIKRERRTEYYAYFVPINIFS